MLVIVTILVVFVATFLAAFLAVLISAGVMERRSQEQTLLGAAGLDASPSLLLREESLSAFSLWAHLLERIHFVDTLKTHISQAQLNWTVGRLTASMLLCGTVALAILASIDWMPLLAIVMGGVLAAVAPYLYVLRLRSRWLLRFEEQFPDALDALCRVLRAGHPLGAALELLAAESPAPISVELRKTFDEWNLGLSWEQAMDSLVRRVPLVDVSVFAAAVKLQTRTGGRLTEVMNKLAETMRESVALRGEVRAIASQGKLTGVILSVLPIFIAIVMTIVNPGYLNILVNHPWGKTIITLALGCLVLAHLVIRKLVDIRL